MQSSYPACVGPALGDLLSHHDGFLSVDQSDVPTLLGALSQPLWEGLARVCQGPLDPVSGATETGSTYIARHNDTKIV